MVPRISQFFDFVKFLIFLRSPPGKQCSRHKHANILTEMLLIILAHICSTQLCSNIFFFFFFFFYKSKSTSDQHLLSRFFIDLKWVTSDLTSRAPVTWCFWSLCALWPCYGIDRQDHASEIFSCESTKKLWPKWQWVSSISPNLKNCIL